MLLLFLGMIASGIVSRITLLAQRQRLFTIYQAHRTATTMALDVSVIVFGIAGIFASFALFDWYVPVSAIALGYGVIAPILVNGNGFPFFYQLRSPISLVSFGCSLSLCGMYISGA